ncbi:hypothetical protein [Thalassomonas actiniarum]|uniref:Uncharacterized protein n=1 Tax=Thalassomonas actiniarum TaxID=485447 RepID=A0AAE9YS92_9GAMM|nr:hypothetical protein [Thalassomonas actiniarum]WDD99762.1 hypothetical protein SG35_003575 [Thalassomonas actiniarum]
MSLLSISLLWLGCLFPYLASPKQQLIANPVPKTLGWAGFVLTLVWVLVQQAQQQGYLVASIVILTAVMCMWTILILLSSHIAKRLALVSSYLERRLLLVSSLGIAFFSLIAITGSYHVV